MVDQLLDFTRIRIGSGLPADRLPCVAILDLIMPLGAVSPYCC